MKDGNLSNRVAKYIYIDAESLFNFKVMVVLKGGVNEKLRLLLREFNVCLFLDRRSRRLKEEDLDSVIATDVFTARKKNLLERLKEDKAVFLVSAERLAEFKDIENVYPIELSVERIKELA